MTQPSTLRAQPGPEHLLTQDVCSWDSHKRQLITAALSKERCANSADRMLPVQAFAVAIQLARRVFEQGAALGFRMRLLDLGGGLTAQVQPQILPLCTKCCTLCLAAHATCFTSLCDLITQLDSALFLRCCTSHCHRRRQHPPPLAHAAWIGH